MCAFDGGPYARVSEEALSYSSAHRTLFIAVRAVRIAFVGVVWSFVFFFQAEDGIRDDLVTGVQTCALPISARLLSSPLPVGAFAESLGGAQGRIFRVRADCCGNPALGLKNRDARRARPRFVPVASAGWRAGRAGRVLRRQLARAPARRLRPRAGAAPARGARRSRLGLASDPRAVPA